MARRTARSSRATRSNRKYIWTAALIEIDTNTGSSPLQAVIANSTDWSAAGGNVPATLIAIRGWLCVRPLTYQAQNNVSEALIVKTDVDDDVGDLDPELVTTYVNESILWTGGYSYKNEAATVSTVQPTYFDINVKAKRKMTAADNVRFVVSQSQGAAATKWNGVLRTLFSF